MPGPKSFPNGKSGSRKVFSEKNPDGIPRTPNRKQAARLAARQGAFTSPVCGCVAHMPGSQNRNK